MKCIYLLLVKLFFCSPNHNPMVTKLQKRLGKQQIRKCIIANPNCSTAIGIRNDALVRLDRLGIDFRNDQGHFRIIAKGGAVIDHDAPTRDRCLREGFRLRTARAENTNIEIFEARLGGFFDDPAAALVADAFARRTGGREEAQVRHWKVAFMQQPNEFLTDRTGRSEDAYRICHSI